MKRLPAALQSVVAAIFLCSLAQAQPPTFEFGPLPGEAFNWPETQDLFTEEVVEIDRPTVVLVTSLLPCNNCALLVAMAASWKNRYENIDVVLVTRQRSDPESMRRELSDIVNDLTVVADDGRVANALSISAQPIIFVVSGERVVLYRHTGAEMRRLIALDAVLARANAGGLEAPTQADRDLEGVNQIQDEWGIEAGNPVVVVLHSVDCLTCQRLVAQGLSLILSDFARRHPDTRFVVLREEQAVHAELTLEEMASTFGDGVRQVLAARMDDNPSVPSPVEASLDDDLDPIVRVVDFTPGAPGDPMLLPYIGTGLVPNIYLFDAAGEYLGPRPYWQGPYDAGGLISFLQGVFGNN